MKTIRYGAPIFLMVLSGLFFINSFTISTAGGGSEAKYFPIFTSVGLFIFSFLYLLEEIKKRTKDDSEIRQLLKKETLKIIASIIFLSLLYIMFFEYLGFLVSTILFLGLLLFMLNGKSKWILNMSVTIISSFTLWIVFNELLNVNLP